jgi:WD40 repeat protein
VGVISPERESEAVEYNNPDRHFRDGQSLGYFGVARLFPEGGGPIAIWGDFDGIAIVASIKDLLTNDTSTGEALAPKSLSVIHGDSQVLCVLVSPLYCDPDTNSATFFLGYASGHVQALKAIKSGEQYSYSVLSTGQAHADEVTALAVMPFHNACIASSSVDGTVMLYPNSFKEPNVLDSPLEACKSSITDEKILCFGATRDDEGRVFLCTGSCAGVLTRWNPVGPLGSLEWKKTSSFKLISVPTQIELLHKTSDIFVVGTTIGSLLTFRTSLSLETPLPRDFDSLKHELKAHIGAVESIKIFRNVCSPSRSSSYSHGI